MPACTCRLVYVCVGSLHAYACWILCLYELMNMDVCMNGTCARMNTSYLCILDACALMNKDREGYMIFRPTFNQNLS